MFSLSTRALAIALAVTAMGCVTRALETSTLAATRTLMEIESQEVLDNVAQIAANPGSMPHFGVVNQGTFQMNDTVGATPGLAWSPFGLTSTTLGFSGQRAGVNQWTVTPIYDPDKLKKMRCLFRHAVNPADVDRCFDCSEYLKSLVTPQPQAALLTTATARVPDTCPVPSGFFKCGRKCDVSGRACFVAHCESLWVWVEPEGVDGLTRLTLMVLDLATAATPSTKVSAPAAIPTSRTYPGAPAESGVTTESTLGGRLQFPGGGVQFSP